MDNTNEVLMVHPRKINLNGPFNSPIKTRRFSVRNYHPTKNLAYKVKSTDIKKLHLDTNCGFLRPYERQEIFLNIEFFDPVFRKKIHVLIEAVPTMIPVTEWQNSSPRALFKNTIEKKISKKMEITFENNNSDASHEAMLSKDQMTITTDALEELALSISRYTLSRFIDDEELVNDAANFIIEKILAK